MTEPAHYPGPWCTVCGGPGIVTFTSLDRARPIGRCHPDDPERRGCGRVILTYDEPEANRAFDRRRRRLATGRHELHLRIAKRNPYCDECDAIRVRTNPLSHD